MTKRMAQAIGLVVLGAVIGAISTARAGASQRNTSAPQTSDMRLLSTPVGLEGVASARFIRDTKSQGCWLEVHPFGTDFLALAAAPESSCKTP
jgi:hypothetical protein